MIPKRNLISKKIWGTILLLSFVGSGCGEEPQQQATAPPAVSVKLMTIEQATLVDSTQYVGTLEAIERVELAPKINGRIKQIFVREGQSITKGQIIAELEPTQQQEDVNAATANIQSQIASRNQAESELRQTISQSDSAKTDIARANANVMSAIADFKSAEADLKRAESDLQLAEINYERSSFLVEGGVQPKQDLDNKTRDLETAKANVEALKKSRDSFAADVQASKEALKATEENFKASQSTVEAARARVDQAMANIRESEGNKGSIEQELIFNSILAPIRGQIGDFNQKKLGDYINIGETLTTITNNQAFHLNIHVPTELLNRLRLNLPVEIVNSDGTPGIRGNITYISPVVDQSSQSVLTKVTFQNDGTLKDDQYVRVRVIWDTKPGFLIPTAAVSSLGDQKFVFVAKQGDSSLVAQQVPIKVGTIQGQEYQVISGINQGDRIAVTKILDLKNETPIKEDNTTSELVN